MFRLVIWRIKRALADHEPGFQIVIKKGATKRIKAEIKKDGTRQFTIHKAGRDGDKKVWYYTTYLLEGDGKTVTPIRNGKYPYEFAN